MRTVLRLKETEEDQKGSKQDLFRLLQPFEHALSLAWPPGVFEHIQRAAVGAVQIVFVVIALALFASVMARCPFDNGRGALATGLPFASDFLLGKSPAFHRLALGFGFRLTRSLIAFVRREIALLARLHGESIAAFILPMAGVALYPEELDLVRFAQFQQRMS